MIAGGAAGPAIGIEPVKENLQRLLGVAFAKAPGRELFVVNADRAESNLTPLTAEQIATITADGYVDVPEAEIAERFASLVAHVGTVGGGGVTA